MTMQTARSIRVAGAAALMVAVGITAALADTIRVCSRHGNGCVSAITRGSGYGAEVRLPGGTWLGCKLDCRNTLREETVDFWSKRDMEKGDRGFRRP